MSRRPCLKFWAKYALASMLALLFFVGAASSGCSGYTVRRSTNYWGEKEGIHRIYIYPVTNNTYKVGVENLVYNQVLREISARGGMQIVRHPEEADAVLRTTVEAADYSPGATTTESELFPRDKIAGFPRGSSDVYVAREYVAVLQCGFSLVRTQSVPGKSNVLWATSLSRSKRFPGSNQLGVFGTTSALINDSEFDRALKDLAEGVMNDLQETMFSLF